MITGIVAEYNPFHNGHQLQIEYARNVLHSDYIIVALSPDFTQRGEVALFDKYTRARIAVELGVDLVVQIPINAATDSAEGYAYGSIKVLDSLGIIDMLLFSSECDDIHILSDIADCVLQESPQYKAIIDSSMREGNNYASARENAIISQLCGDDINVESSIRNILQSPNNILGIEYIKALQILNSNIKPVTMRRIGDYNSVTRDTDNICSASAIREEIRISNTIDNNYIPAQAISTYTQLIQEQEYLLNEDASIILHSCLIQHATNKISLLQYRDCNSDLANKILNKLPEFRNYISYKESLKSKDITDTRISRVLCHILLGITHDMYQPLGNRTLPIVPYIYILGCNQRGIELMKLIKSNSTLPYYTSIKDIENNITDEAAQKLLSTEQRANMLYNGLLTNKTKKSYPLEMSRKFLKIDNN